MEVDQELDQEDWGTSEGEMWWAIDESSTLMLKGKWAESRADHRSSV